MRAEVKHPARSGHEAAGRRAGAGPSPNAGSYDPGAAAGHERAAGSGDLAPTGHDPPVAGDAATAADVLDVAGASRLLRIGRNAVYELVGRNAIPHRRLGKHIRFSRAAIMRWFDSWSSQGAKEGQ
jgi:excisionase family DNA binding protein